MRNILIIGGSCPIGMAIINRFLINGDLVIATYNGNQIEKRDNLKTYYLHLEQLESVDKFIKDISINIFDVIIFVAGILPGKDLLNYNDILLDQVMMINFTAQVNVLRKLLPYCS